jgi:hypothetical protein
MDEQGFHQRPFRVSDWLELGDRLGPDRRQCVLGVFEREVTKLDASRENLRRAERMMAESHALLEKMRGLSETANLLPDDRGRLDAVVATIEQTQTLLASHYARLEQEWRKDGFPEDSSSGRASGNDP